ncbi:Protein CBR-PRMT-6 [Caenorhabditis briggsae]|uniref:Protein CBR-PRMT-6 n=1 Tax=Caenorhabditis briggsae TaxID=6238 RepID=A8XBD3_CAEBR|nr:Protein CBR-PRMT-6 [Caenorhabditis briggsae]CAP29948.2 Protein CBR-PRMT-6 [Caenorhabditis briggsae]
MPDFPSEAYTEAQQKWLGRDHLITPTIKKAIGNVLEGKKVLDVGCGNGHYSFDFLQWGADEVVGIDNSPEMIQICQDSQKKLPESSKIDFHESNITDFSLQKHFDVATAFFVLQFLHSKSDVAKAIQNISNHLKSGGILFGLIPNGIEGVNPPEDMGWKLGAQIQKTPGSHFFDGEIRSAEAPKLLSTLVNSMKSASKIQDSPKSNGSLHISQIMPKIYWGKNSAINF